MSVAKFETWWTLLVNYAAGLTSNHIIAEAEKSEKRAAAALSNAASAAVH